MIDSLATASGSDTPIDERIAVRDLLKDFFGDSKSLSASVADKGVSTRVYRVQRGSERFYLRILPERGETFGAEARAHQVIRAAGVKAPEVLYYEARNEQLGLSVMLTTEIPGQPLHRETPAEFAEQIVTEAGRDLARINQVSVDGFGWLRRSSDAIPTRLVAEHTRLDSLLRVDYEPAIVELERHDVLNQHELNQLTRIALFIRLSRLVETPRRGVWRSGYQRLSQHWDVSERAKTLQRSVSTRAANTHEESRLTGAMRQVEHLFDASAGRLVHGDFDTSHIFYDEDGYAGIIDFGEIRGMPQLYDLAHHHMHDTERLPYSTLNAPLAVAGLRGDPTTASGLSDKDPRPQHPDRDPSAFPRVGEIAIASNCEDGAASAPEGYCLPILLRQINPSLKGNRFHFVVH